MKKNVVRGALAATAAGVLLFGVSTAPASAYGVGVAFSCAPPTRVITWIHTQGASILHKQKSGGVVYTSLKKNPRGDSSWFSSSANLNLMTVTSTGYGAGQYIQVDAFDAYCA